MDSVEDTFGKDLGLMHEVIITGRKVGFTRDDWAAIAHRESLMRNTLNFIRRCDASSFPETLTAIEKADRLARLAEKVLPFNGECISCGTYVGHGRWYSRSLLNAFEEIGLDLSGKSKRVLKSISEGSDSCFEPTHELFGPLKEFLGVESPTRFDSQMVSEKKNRPGEYVLECVVTPTTSMPNVVLFKEALFKHNVRLEVRLLTQKKPESAG